LSHIWYGDGVDTITENGSFFFLIWMHWLLSVRSRGH